MTPTRSSLRRSTHYGAATPDFVSDLAAPHVQITGDGHKAYLEAMEETLGANTLSWLKREPVSTLHGKAK